MLKWGDRNKMVCETCAHKIARISEVGILPECRHDMLQFNPWQKGGGRGCPMWEQQIEIPENQEAQ